MASVTATLQIRAAVIGSGPRLQNLIQMQLKAYLCKAAERTVDGLWNAIGWVIELFAPAECQNYFKAAG